MMNADWMWFEAYALPGARLLMFVASLLAFDWLQRRIRITRRKGGLWSAPMLREVASFAVVLMIAGYLASRLFTGTLHYPPARWELTTLYLLWAAFLALRTYESRWEG